MADTNSLYEISALEFDEDTLQRIVASVVQKVAERKALGLYESPVWNESGFVFSGDVLFSSSQESFPSRSTLTSLPPCLPGSTTVLISVPVHEVDLPLAYLWAQPRSLLPTTYLHPPRNLAVAEAVAIAIPPSSCPSSLPFFFVFIPTAGCGNQGPTTPLQAIHNSSPPHFHSEVLCALRCELFFLFSFLSSPATLTGAHVPVFLC